MNNKPKNNPGLLASENFVPFSFKKSLLSAIFRLIILGLLISPVLMTGCGFMMADRITVNGSNKIDEKNILRKGYMAFQLKDFRQAEKIFSSLQSTSNEEVSRKALYALACTKWAIAETPKAKRKAIDQWKKIRDSRHEYGDCNDFKLLEILLEIEGYRSCKNGQKKEMIEQAEASKCQSQLFLREEEIKQLNQRIKTMKGKVIALKIKIKSIEEIDQKIQEKKENPPPP